MAATVCNRAMAPQNLIRATTQYNIADGLLVQQSNTEAAIFHYTEATLLLLGFVLTHLHHGGSQAHEGRTKDAVEQYEQAWRSRPGYPEARNNLGVVLPTQEKNH